LLGAHARGGHGLVAVAQDGVVEKDRFHILKPCSFFIGRPRLLLPRI
jgi:hypothetical protein